MESEEFQKARSILELFYLAKDHRALRQASQDQKLHPSVRSYACGLLARPWLPWGKVRKIIMCLIAVLVILLAIIFQNSSLLLALFVPLLFSPRLVAEVSMRLGKLSRGRQ